MLQRTTLISFLCALLGACAASSDPNLIDCNVIEKICYRGYHPDRIATRNRFGVAGIRAIDERNRMNQR